MLDLDVFCASVSKTCPKVIAASLYTISARESFPRSALLLGRRGSLPMVESAGLDPGLDLPR